MEDRMRQRILEFADRLAAEEKSRLEAAGTLVDLELLTAQIGDLVARQLANQELSRRCEEFTAKGVHRCPDCHRECPVERDPEPLILQGIRGDLEYQEPRCHCPHCRRAFFPSGRQTATTSP